MYLIYKLYNMIDLIIDLIIYLQVIYTKMLKLYINVLNY